VRAIAPLLFGVPVVVPSPGEYVAVGAARQAAWARAGAEAAPLWRVGTESESDPHPGPEGAEITGRYAALLRDMHGRQTER
jgi:xylulokinase